MARIYSRRAIGFPTMASPCAGGGELAKMNATILLPLLLLVAMTPAIAHATIPSSEMAIGQQATRTNEGSYLYGYNGGKSEWDSCAHTDGEGDCTFAHNYCSNPIEATSPVYDAKHYGYPMVNLGYVSNMTACIHGYAHAWNHFCDHVSAKKADEPCPLSPHDLS